MIKRSETVSFRARKKPGWITAEMFEIGRKQIIGVDELSACNPVIEFSHQPETERLVNGCFQLPEPGIAVENTFKPFPVS